MDIIIEYGINWIFYKCEDYRPLVEWYVNTYNKPCSDGLIWKDHDGYYNIRIHK